MLSLFSVAAGFAIWVSSTLAYERAFHGPKFPPPFGVSLDTNFSASAATLTEALHLLLNSSDGGTDANSIAIMGGSVFESMPAFKFYSTGRQVEGATSQVGPESIFRIASISKLFTVYSLLVQAGYDVFHRPVSDYIPELKQHDVSWGDNPRNIQWDVISVGALASHMTGLPRDYNHGDLASQALPFESLGLPELEDNLIPKCDGNATQPLCSRAEFLRGLQHRNPVFYPWNSPAYSNAAFRIIGYVLEKLAGSPFSAVLKQHTIDPLELNSTHSEKPDDELGVNPSDGSMWDMLSGEDLPSGGIYSSVQDLCTFGKAILGSKTLAPATTRRWMKPVALTDSLSFALGIPWEIFRQDLGGHVVDFYTKSGRLGQYHSQLVLIPDLQFVYAILVAGPDGNLSWNAADAVRGHLMPVLQQLARSQAALHYAGRYASTQGNNSMHIKTDDQPGLSIEEWISNGVDFLQVLSAYGESVGYGAVKAVRMYPTGSRGTGRMLFRLVFLVAEDEAPTNADVIFAKGTGVWTMVDAVSYGQKPMDEVLFTLNEEFEAVSLEHTGLTVNMTKIIAAP